MAQKRGKGGYGSENYDPETGRYIKQDGPKDSHYHSGAHYSVNDLIKSLKEGYYDDEKNKFSELFANDKDEDLEEDEELWEQKHQLVSYLQEMLDDYYTREDILATDFPKMTDSEFNEWSRICQSRLTYEESNGFHNGYKGAGQQAFEFNKALRMGFDKFYKLYPQFMDHFNLNPDAIIARVKKLDKCTSVFEFPENKQVYRYVDTAPLISWFGNTGIFEGLKTIKNQYNYDELDGPFNAQDIALRLQNLEGTIVPPDNSFTSFSAVTGQTHMGKRLSENKRRIKIVYNVPKGTKAYFSGYERESEGIFNRNVGFFIQKVRTEKNEYGEELVVLEYGVQK